ncbi:uncharacterized protein LOC128236910 [Mya arenaria]|uniref:uncharacterized protein LOC128236910 n=1 Tax=Mya arenaria TaxID=6604 RepID=UPI0022E45E84|nr:uncharacterized protein LOC128236910 [Mya arenaria]
MRDYLRNKRKRNHFSCSIVTDKVFKHVGSFTESKLTDVHGKISQTLGVQRACIDQCSQQYKNDFRSWCQTCKDWRTELLKYHLYPQNIIWSKLKSWEWPIDPTHIAEVFMIQDFDKTNPNLQDVTVSFNIWKRCIEFPRSLIPIADAVRKCRNKLCHNIMDCDDNLKTKTFTTIKTLVRHNDFSQHIGIANIADLSEHIRDLENDQLTEYKHEIEEMLQEIKEKLTDVNKQFSIQWKLFCSFFVVYIACVFHQLHFYPHSNLIQGILTMNWMRNEIGECLPEDIKGDFRNPLRLETYLKRHKELVGREWLFNLTEHSLQNMNASKNGLVLEADMGYGKSAFVAHTVCAGENSQGHRLREMLVAFHLCKFDVILTKKPGLFIQRLTSMIFHFIPELEFDDQCLEHYRMSEICNVDPLGCTENCLIHHLDKLDKSGFKPSAVKVILIDAIDECANNRDTNDNPVFEVIRKRFYLFPNWIKLLMTSRRSKENVMLLLDFDVIYLRSMDKRNLRDIQSYLNITNDKILEQTASFIIAKYMVESNNFTEGNLRNLNRFYNDQFERIFGKEFALARIILEVTATTFWTITKHNIIEIITNYNKISTVDEGGLNNEFDKVEHFFITENDTFSFNHHSVVEWLETKSPETYRIRRANGHKMNAMYLLSVIATGSNIVIDIVDLAIHLMNSENFDELIDQFKNITLEQRRHMEMNFSESPLIRCVKRTDCSNIPSVLYFYYNNTEELSSENFTAAYIAAATGKLSALKSLCDHGADVNFRVKSYHGTKRANVQSATLIKQWGYGLLDIAAQNGHVHIVNFILTDTSIFGNYTHHILNGFNLKPVHLACKYGCVVTVKEFYLHNKEIVDYELCLHFASDGGHVALMSYLVNELNITEKMPGV